MDIPSTLNIKRIFCPENIWDRIYGCFFGLLLLYVFWKSWGFQNLTSYRFFLSIIPLFGFNIWYVVYYFIRKRRLKGLKEIYEAYYWLITSIPPSTLQVGFASPFKGVPKLIIERIRQNGVPYSNQEKVLTVSGSRIDCIITIPKDPETKVLFNSPCLAFRVSDLFEWCLKKDIPRLHTWDGKEITGENDKRRLLDELSTETKKAGHSLVNTLSYTTNAIAHLSTEHNKNLKELSDS